VQAQLLPNQPRLLMQLRSLQLNPKAPAFGQDSAIHCRAKIPGKEKGPDVSIRAFFVNRNLVFDYSGPFTRPYS
jgi:hypothetical protein